MKKHYISESFYRTKTRDRIGGTINTNVYLEKGIFKAYSYYWQDEEEEIVGFAESYNDEEAVKLSRKDLRREWKVNQQAIALT